MASAEKYAAWIVANKDKKGTPEFDTVTKAYMAAKQEKQPVVPVAQTEQVATPGGGVVQGAGNLLAGAVRGAGSIGATILAPYDIAKDALAGKGLSLESNRRRRSDIDAGLQEAHGAEPDSMMYQGGKLATEVAGTLGTGRVLAKGVQAVAPSATALTNALASAGSKTGAVLKGAPLSARVADMATRMAGGASTGGAAVALVSPEDAGTGAAIGAALPPAVSAVSKAIPMIGRGVANVVGSPVGTSTGGKGLQDAARAGAEGGKKAAGFTANMRGNVPMEDVLNDAKSGLVNMRLERGKQYRSGMVDISSDKTVLDIKPIIRSLIDEKKIGRFGDLVKNKSTKGTYEEIAKEIKDFVALDHAKYRTVEGVDALKQAIGDIRARTEFGTPSRLVVDRIYNTVKDQITKQAPAYAKTMSGYEAASKQIREIDRLLGKGENASADAAMRKLQSITRNNVNTNYGNRLGMVKRLEKAGATDLTSNLSAQSLNSWTPRGLGGVVAGGIGGAGLMTGNPLALAILAAKSPRLMGEAAFLTGKVAGKTGRAANKLSDLYRAAPLLFTGQD